MIMRIGFRLATIETIAILNDFNKFVGVVPRCLPQHLGATTGGLPLQELCK